MNILTKFIKSGNWKFLKSNVLPRRLLTCSIAKNKENIDKQVHDAVTSLMEFKGHWPSDELQRFKIDMKVLQHFISETEESKLFDEIEPYMKSLRYEFDHWDNAIHGFRETERKHWYPHNREVLERVRQVGFDGEIMPYIHILDLAPQGLIKPHVDSTRYCGPIIAGISLLSDCVMRLVRTDDHRQMSEKSTDSADDYRSQPKTIIENKFYADLLLPRRSLYIMSNSARYNFTHEILTTKDSKFNGQPITKTRRISIICRNEP